MTEEAQRIAIAEACGWKGIRSSVHFGRPVQAGMNPAKGGQTDRIPDYVNDLNAMHEAEKMLADEQIDRFVKFLWEAMMDSPESRIGTIHATAAQRAEALLKTLGKWDDSK